MKLKNFNNLFLFLLIIKQIDEVLNISNLNNKISIDNSVKVKEIS